MVMTEHNRRWVVKPLVPEEVYTDREEFLEYFYQAALEASTRRSVSTVLLGQRRMGKTEIFKRVVNRLFFDQDHTDPQAVVPIFFTFPDEIVSREHFALEYVENIVRWYAAFRLGEPAILATPRKPRDLAEYVEQAQGLSNTFKRLALSLLIAIDEGGVNLPEQKALYLPREISDWEDSTIVMFLDEFQNTQLPEYQFRVVGFMQEAVESPTCPHFVTGSAMSMLIEILGTGALYGRFRSHPIETFTDYWGNELAIRVARYYHVELPEIMAPVVSERCGGNPYYITAVIQQAAEQRAALRDEHILNKMLAIDISSGFIWADLHNQVTRWIAKINEHGITKWVLYLAALEEGKQIDLTRIQEELWRRKRKQVSLDTIKDVLVKLSRGDLLEYMAFGNWFRKINDPILEEFLKVWGRIEVVQENRTKVYDDLNRKYLGMKRRFSEYEGYLAEVYMIQILWNSQRRTLPGRYFHSSEDIQMPERFSYIAQRSRPRIGQGQEVDIYAAAGWDVWIAESKWWRGRKVGPEVVQHLLDQARQIIEREGEEMRVRVWLFAHDGVTPEAESLLLQHQAIWSTRADLDGLLEEVNLRKLPAI